MIVRPQGISEDTCPARTDEAELARLAQAVAEGDIPLPLGLAPEALAQVAEYVREQRRTRLIRFLARQVAQHMARRRSP